MRAPSPYGTWTSAAGMQNAPVGWTHVVGAGIAHSSAVWIVPHASIVAGGALDTNPGLLNVMSYVVGPSVVIASPQAFVLACQSPASADAPRTKTSPSGAP